MSGLVPTDPGKQQTPGLIKVNCGLEGPESIFLFMQKYDYSGYMQHRTVVPTFYQKSLKFKVL